MVRKRRPTSWAAATDDVLDRARILREQLPKFVEQKSEPPVYVRPYSEAVLQGDSWLKLFTDAGLALSDIACSGAGIFSECKNLQQFADSVKTTSRRHKAIPEGNPAVTVTLTGDQYAQLAGFYALKRVSGQARA